MHQLRDRITHTHKYTVVQQFMTFLSPFPLFFFPSLLCRRANRTDSSHIRSKKTARSFTQTWPVLKLIRVSCPVYNLYCSWSTGVLSLSFHSTGHTWNTDTAQTYSHTPTSTHTLTVTHTHSHARTGRKQRDARGWKQNFFSPRYIPTVVRSKSK